MTISGTPPTATQRLSAAVSFALIVLVVGVTLVRVVDDAGRVVLQAVLLVVLLGSGWQALTRSGRTRTFALSAAVVVLAALVATVVAADGPIVVSLIARLAVLAAAIGLARHALGTTRTALVRAETPGTPVPAAERGVLFMNLKSGGGKAERFHLVDECRRRGIEPVILEPGQDWLQVVRDKAASGVDVLGMAGGDGSQAMVGTVAAELGLPMVVVPAGTRNHLALDLGLDREDVVGALDAYGDAVERQMDLADLNGHVFVNNVSLGLYAAIVRSPEYRDNKRDTTLATLPQVLGPESEPFDLRFTRPDGNEHVGAHIIQISNNPYGETLASRTGRPRLDTHQLGVVSLVLDRPGAAAAFLAALATGHPERFEGFDQWAAPSFTVDSDGPVEICLDGESMLMDPPLRFTIRPAPVRVRLPHHAFGYSPAARALGWRGSLAGLWNVVLGRPVVLPG